MRTSTSIHRLRTRKRPVRSYPCSPAPFARAGPAPGEQGVSRELPARPPGFRRPAEARTARPLGRAPSAATPAAAPGRRLAHARHPRDRSTPGREGRFPAGFSRSRKGWSGIVGSPILPVNSFLAGIASASNRLSRNGLPRFGTPIPARVRPFCRVQPLPRRFPAGRERREAASPPNEARLAPRAQTFRLDGESGWATMHPAPRGERRLLFSTCARSSVDRALASGARCRRFESSRA